MINVRRIAGTSDAPLQGLAELLIDAVNGGASVGFLAPMRTLTADRYWSDVVSALDRDLALFTAEDRERVVGSVQLRLCEKENGVHRAEVQKLFVLGAHRGRGIASLLLRELESQARALGRTLLVLDTQSGSHAETVYRHLQWIRAGEIPGFATTPDGALHPTTYYYKMLAP